MKTNPHDSAAWRLFHNNYHIRLPSLAQYSMDHMPDAIINVTGDKKIDKANVNMLIDTRRSPAGMAMLMAQGYGMELVNRWDCVAIYSSIIQHFQDWVNESYIGVPAECFPPIEDFRTFELLALDMHDVAQTMQPHQVKEADGIFERLRNLNRSRNPVMAERMERQRMTTRDGRIRPYISLVDQIEKYVIGE